MPSLLHLPFPPLPLPQRAPCTSRLLLELREKKTHDTDEEGWKTKHVSVGFGSCVCGGEESRLSTLRSVSVTFEGKKPYFVCEGVVVGNIE